MADYLALKAEIAKPAYAAMTDDQIADAINTGTVTDERPTSGADIGAMWARRGVLGVARERAQRAALTPAQRATAWTAIEMVTQNGFAGFDPTVPAQRAALVTMLDSFVTDTIMSAADKTATLAALSRMRTIAQSLGWTNERIWPADVAAARKMEG